MAKEPLRYTVTGRAPFPVDMLRHDGSEPSTGRDRALIERMTDTPTELADGGAGVVSVELVMTELGLSRPNTARWRSMGWDVPGDTDIDAIETERADRARRKALLDATLAKLTDEERWNLVWHGLQIPH